MIERISPFLTSKLTSLSALTPPKRSVMPRTSSSTSSKRWPGRPRPAGPDRSATGLFRRLRHRRRLGREIADRHLGLDLAGMAVLEGHHGLDRDLVGAGIESLDQSPIPLVDHRAP